MVIKLVCGLIAATVILSVAPAHGKERHEMRFYKINKDEITQRVRFSAAKSRKPGCHNFLGKARVHKAVQFGYANCKVYSKKRCAADSIMSFYRDKEPEPTQELSQGFGWYPVGEHKRGEVARSWFCE